MLHPLQHDFELQEMIKGDASSIPISNASLIFTMDDSLVAIDETIVTHMSNLDALIRSNISDELAEMPNSPCEASVLLSSLDQSTVNGSAVISATFEVEVSICELGIALTVAEGLATIEATVTARTHAGRLHFQSEVDHVSDISPTVDAPFFNDAIIRTAVREALEGVRAKTAAAINRLNLMVAEAQDKNRENMEIGPLYRPVLEAAVFIEERSELALKTVRKAQVRSGTACAIRTRLDEKLGT